MNCNKVSALFLFCDISYYVVTNRKMKPFHKEPNLRVNAFVLRDLFERM